MRIISAVPKTIGAQVPGKSPEVMGPVETVFPRRTVGVPFGQVLTVSDKDGKHILARYTAAGVLEIKEGEDPGEVLFRAKEIRYRHLMRMINEYKREQGARQGRGDAVMLPGDHLRHYLNEAKKLQKEVVEQDPVMASNLPPLPQDQGKIEPDPMATELGNYGISPEASPLTPGVRVPVLDSELGL